jgi:hypothetical protein
MRNGSAACSLPEIEPCLCGCGRPVPTHDAKGRRRTGYAHGHNRRGVARTTAERQRIAAERSPQWRGDDATSGAIQKWINRRWPKTGTCERCGRSPGASGVGGACWLYVDRPGILPRPKSEDDFRKSYIEVCRSCLARVVRETS